MRRWLALLFLAWAAAATAAPLALPPAPTASLTQRLHARLPRSLVFIDDTGAPVALGQLLGRVPVVMLLGYYHCPNLCSTLMDGVLQALAGVRLPQGAYRIVAVSIDPRETPQIASAKKTAYMSVLGERARDLSFLTGNRGDIAELAQAVGFSYSYDANVRQYVHPAGFWIVTPRGEISRYFMGVDFDPYALRLALAEASDGRIGTVTDRLALLCSHYDPATGHYSLAVMSIVRAVCFTVLALLASWLWLHRRGRQ